MKTFAMKKLTLALGMTSVLLTHHVQADFCDGRRFGFLKMPITDRIEQLRDGIAQEISAIEAATIELEFDVAPFLSQQQEQLRQEIATIKNAAQQLCQAVKNGQDTVTLKGVTLQGSHEIDAQLRIDLTTYRVNQTILAALAWEKAGLSQVRENLLQKASELHVLEKRVQHLIDPTQQGGGRNANILIRQGCVTIEDSRTLRLRHSRAALDEKFAHLAQKNKVDTLKPGDLAVFKADCNMNQGYPSATISHAAEKPWYQLW